MVYEVVKFNPYRGIAVDRFNVEKHINEIPLLTPELVEEIKDSRTVYFYNQETQELYRVERRENGYKALVAIRPEIQYTLDINGIHMHRVKGISPLKDAWLKVEAAKVKKGHIVLDTCTGLGYTALESLKRGARVVTVEIDPDVIWIARHNPYSRGLANDNVTIIRGNILDVIRVFPDDSFDEIIHDPPRLTKKTGDLYGAEFYKELLRVLKPGGLLFHYTGHPKRTRGVRLMSITMSRLSDIGFIPVTKDYRAQGVVVLKPI